MALGEACSRVADPWSTLFDSDRRNYRLRLARFVAVPSLALRAGADEGGRPAFGWSLRTIERVIRHKA